MCKFFGTIIDKNKILFYFFIFCDNNFITKIHTRKQQSTFIHWTPEAQSLEVVSARQLRQRYQYNIQHAWQVAGSEFNYPNTIGSRTLFAHNTASHPQTPIQIIGTMPKEQK